jgi:AcrR family transcriptional regulator
MQAVARHGLAKLEMTDVGECAGVSRGTLYRYFSSRDELLQDLSIREAYRFWESCLDALRRAPEGEERLHLLVLHATRHVRDHAALQRILETDPALVLHEIRERFPSIRRELHHLIGPLVESTQLVQSGIVTVSQLVDWLTRLMASAYLIPSPDAEEMARGFTAVLRLLTADPSSVATGSRSEGDTPPEDGASEGT